MNNSSKFSTKLFQFSFGEFHDVCKYSTYVVGEEKNNVAAKNTSMVHSPPMVLSIIPPFPLLPTLSKKGFFRWGGER
jgi:hypothetical protein